MKRGSTFTSEDLRIMSQALSTLAGMYLNHASELKKMENPEWWAGQILFLRLKAGDLQRIQRKIETKMLGGEQ